MSYSVEKVMRVYDDKEGAYIEVRHDPDAPDSSLEIHTTGNQTCIDWYGEQRIMLNSREHALALARAITEMAEMIP
ncbi:hypothetical protein [Pseudomonas aeruginosa]|uniref:hypothetical protein n=1 Tax=Pseudomonas aeruginosa TaxID=287 RepID=UPI00104D3D29|nr:hypothetical protein [Pseudomonas aeruginosa]NYU72118.1 hypothetical protein [Pseudomonas aeruginosa]HCE6897274.1 hypothetical protein [Pseudomonas aeruginosa]HCE6903014.1 hypothetical protein [Pseudomonas aeruginosa]HCE7019935.1 hypothetical protein [Pseudomonas aeruginosa]HCE7064518.1 hypothetical protein [Pseudomonas aeruginosa]